MFKTVYPMKPINLRDNPCRVVEVSRKHSFPVNTKPYYDSDLEEEDEAMNLQPYNQNYQNNNDENEDYYYENNNNNNEDEDNWDYSDSASYGSYDNYDGSQQFDQMDHAGTDWNVVDYDNLRF